MALLPRQEIVHFRRIASHGTVPQRNTEEQIIAEISDGKGKVEVVKTLSYADHPLIAGAGYKSQDVKLAFSNFLSKQSSGLARKHNSNNK